jgi:ATP-binding cassette subfamily B (MDR/TAP) protein 1
VHFAYRNNETGELKREVFSDLSFMVKAGETVAFVGESGSGKSTVAKLVSRMYDCDKGQILVDGVDVRELDVRKLREKIGIVSQEPLLFDKSIRDNIALGLPSESVTLERIKTVAKAANAHEFISSSQFPEGYDTFVGAKGGKLSGGQKQRVAIARGLLRDPDILILDEATSALDMQSEQKVQAALQANRGERTTLIIAHRLTTVRAADRIIVLGEGKDGMGGGTQIIEQGSHDELMGLEGAYCALVGGQQGKGDAHEEEAPTKELPLERQSSAEQGKVMEMGDSKNTKAAKKEKKIKLYPVSAGRVWGFAHGKWGVISLGLLCSVFAGAVWPVMATVFSKMLAAFSNHNDDVHTHTHAHTHTHTRTL